MKYIKYTLFSVLFLVICISFFKLAYYLIDTYVCCPGEAGPCTTVYGNRGERVCKSSGFWGDHCIVNGEVEEM